MSAFDEGFQAAFYYQDPDQNVVELNMNYYGNDWTATEYMKNSPSIAERPNLMAVDPEKMIAARKAGGSALKTARACLCRRVRARNAV